MTQIVNLKRKVEIYENELTQILDDGTNYQISFDLHNGGECKCSTEKKIWFKNKGSQTEFDDEIEGNDEESLIRKINQQKEENSEQGQKNDDEDDWYVV